MYLYNHLEGCDKFFWRVYKVIKTVAGERLRNKDVEVVDTLQILTRLRRLEIGQEHLENRQGDINTTLDLHEEELVNNACNTFIEKQNEADRELILKNVHFVKTENVQQCRSRASEWLNKNGIRYFTNVYSINVDKRTCRVVFNSERDKKSAEGILARLREDSKGKSKVTTVRPDARPYKGDVRKSYDEIKNKLWTYWQQYCTNKGFEQLIVAEHVWSKNIFILQRVSGKGADSKLFYEFTDPTNMESWLVFNREQNPFDILYLTKEVLNN